MSKLPLEKVKVLDLTRVLVGPFCSLQLADLGAEAIKIEAPGGGDESRSFGPFMGERSAYFLSLNRNKKSVTLNLKSSEGQEILKKMIRGFDVLVENFRPGTMEKWDLGYETLSKINPGLIYTSVSGFGATGPDCHKPAYDIVVQGRGGVMSITGQEGGEPTRVGASIGDLTAGLFTTVAILSALYHARNTGKGQKIDISMLDCQVALLENAIARYAVSGEAPGPLGNRHPSITPFNSFKTKDGYIIIAVGNNRLWARLCQALEVQCLIEDSRFSDNEKRTVNYRQLETALEGSFIRQTSAFWLERLEREEIPCGLIQNIGQVLRDPQVLSRGMVREMDIGGEQTLITAGIPYKFSDTPCERINAPPLLGEHTAPVLRDYTGLSDKEMAELRRKKVI